VKITVNLPGGPTKFRSTVVKPYLTDPEHIQVEDIRVEDIQVDETVPKTACTHEPSTETVSIQKPPPTETEEAQPPRRGRGRPRKYPPHVNTADIVTAPAELGGRTWQNFAVT
jgi:hypothetical protein